MNFLAHFTLAHTHPDHLLGQFLGDFVRGDLGESVWTGQVRAGIRSHRLIDAASDRSAFYLEAKSTLPKADRRYANLVMDVYCDYLLHQCWDTLVADPFAERQQLWFSVLTNNLSTLPHPARRFAETILTHDILASYRVVEGIEQALERIGQRFQRPVGLVQLLPAVRENEERWLAEFPAFFHDMRDLVPT